MKKLLITVFMFMLGLGAFAGEKEDALAFFNKFISASNNYSTELPNMYSDSAKITRQVIKPDGTLVNIPFTISQYRSQMKLSAKLAKIKNYKNNYSNVSVTKAPNGYKINSTRMPSLGGPALKATMVVQKQPDGKWLIVEELMQTKEQIFLKYAK